ncbi:response regulator [Yersinia rochesterensis]|uniref:Response regulator n=2 Tax=Yersinia rochesterensis TaxID=1604335 RepID=A0ABM5SLY2_9GAMM|nr:response regulator [Yersinia rochesterensis]AJI89086.1 response regulator [Yersinia frederiksenii Y225]AJJ35545.1 response regulator [Yersinia rochesterensis]CRY61923.1 putative two-component response regulator [Yersinia kristensenii]
MTNSAMIVDDHPAIHEKSSQSKDFSTTYESVDSNKALETLKDNTIDLVIIDIEFPNFDGFLLLKKLQQCGFTDKSLLFSAKNEHFFAVQALQAGASGLISKNISEILFSAQNVLRGYSLFPSETLSQLAGQPSSYKL